MKKIAVVALLATMASVAVLVACGGETPAPAAPENAASSASAAPTDSAPPAPSAAPSK